MATASLNHLLIKQKNLNFPQTRATRIPAPTILLQMCHNFSEVRQVHAQLVLWGLIDRGVNAERLIESYVSLGQIHQALSVFYTIPSPDIFAHNTIIRGLILGKCPCDSLLVYDKLLLRGLTPDNYTFTFVLKACSHLKAHSEGKQLHGQIIKAGIKPDTHIYSSLIHMYANSSNMDSAEHVLAEFSEENVPAKNSMITGYMSQGQVKVAREVFDLMTKRDSASWSVMITGYTRNGMYAEALAIFREMMASQAPLNESTLVSVLSACGHLGALEQGKWIHAYVNRLGAKISIILGTSLVDMYAKCGCIERSYEIFRNMPEKDVIAWGVIISGFAIHGEAGKCCQLFNEMLANGTQPNGIVFVALLTACSHAGYVELGHKYFNRMVSFYGIKPSIEHYGCMIDLFGRAGMLVEAEEIIFSMPEEPNAVIWGSLLGACRIHKDLRRGEFAFKQLIKLEPLSGDRYKLRSCLLSDAGDREGANKARKEVQDKNLETACGYSFIEVEGSVHSFEVANIDHSRSQEIYRMLQG